MKDAQSTATPRGQSERNIFEKPLPVLLDEINEAAADARQAAIDAKLAGEKAAEDVMKRLRKLFLAMASDIEESLGEKK